MYSLQKQNLELNNINQNIKINYENIYIFCFIKFLELIILTSMEYVATWLQQYLIIFDAYFSFLIFFAIIHTIKNILNLINKKKHIKRNIKIINNLYP
jgi:hypothetical protein